MTQATVLRLVALLILFYAIVSVAHVIREVGVRVPLPFGCDLANSDLAKGECK